MAFGVGIIVLLSFLTSAVGYVDYNIMHTSKPNQTTLCPSRCTCNLNGRMVHCNDTFIWNFKSFFHRIPQNVRNLTIYRASFPEISANYVTRLTHLRSLTLSKCIVVRIEKEAFHNNKHLEILDLSHNNMKTLGAKTFSGLQKLMDLDLQNNRLEMLHDRSFAGLKNLKSLKLQDNLLRYLPSNLFKDLHSLVSLNLSNNPIIYLESGIFSMNIMLRGLSLSSNRLRSLSHNIFANLTKLETVYLDDNPWECSCYMHWLAEEIARDKSTYKNSDNILCSSPDYLESSPMKDIQNSSCISPFITFIANDSNVLNGGSIMLDCIATGYPTPSVYWVNPHGTILAHELQREWINESTIIYSNFSISGEALFETFENGSLLVANFRGYFSGNYTCYAVNPIGETGITVIVIAVAALRDVFHFSLFISGICTGFVLAVGIVIGLIKCCVLRCRHKQKLRRRKRDSIYRIGAFEPMLSDSNEKLKRKNASGKSSVQSSPTRSRSQSSSEATAEDEQDEMLDYYYVTHIKDTIDEMGLRLRTGVEKRVEKMRTQMKTQMSNLHESSNQYMQNLRDSGQKAVQKVRVGVVLSVEQVKQQMMSMKELCGRGDMCQTVSTFSVATDVDSREQSTVVKSITYV